MSAKRKIVILIIGLLTCSLALIMIQAKQDLVDTTLPYREHYILNNAVSSFIKNNYAQVLTPILKNLQ